MEHTGRTTGRSRWVAALTIGALVATTNIAVADTIVAGENVTKEPGDVGTAYFYLDEDDPTDPVNGCNANGSTPVTIDVTSSSVLLVIDAPGSVEVEGCGTDAVVSIGYTVSAEATDGEVITISGTAAAGAAGDPNGRVHSSGNPKVFTYPTYTGDGFTVTVSAPSDPCASVGVPDEPTITSAPVAADGNNGWFTSAPTVSATSTTAGATIAYSTDNATWSATAPTLGEGTTLVYATATSATCDKTSTTASREFKVDTGEPYNIAFTGIDVVTGGGDYYFGFVPPAPGCEADDDISGLASCVVTGYANTVGQHTLTATATDHAGNDAADTLDYTVNRWSVGTGFKSPVTSDLTKVNTVKAGSTVPLKFNVTAGPNGEITSLLTLGATWQWSGKKCDVSDIELAITEFADSGTTSLRYEDGQWIRNWKTPTTKGCGVLTTTLADGTQIKAEFKLK